VAFSPDGLRLASAGGKYGELGEVKLWDARPLTPEVQTEREAFSLLEFFCPKSPRKADLFKTISGNKTISEASRQKALALLEPYWQNYVHGEATSLVQELFSKPLLRPEVLVSIRADAKLRDELRREALVLAEQYPENALRLNNASWEVVHKPGLALGAYRLALRQAEAACRLEAAIPRYLNTLGVAQYRLGKYKEALDTLTRSGKLNSASPAGTQPADLAFLALAQHQLGQKEKAQASLERLRQILKQPQWAKNEEAQGFLREAEELLKEQPVKPKK
jgi:tetratricopeptide (TPR) repeat protein